MVGCNSGRATPFLRRHRPSAIPNHQPRRNATYHSREAVQTTEASSLALARGARSGSLGAFIEDKNSGTILLQQALRRGMRAREIDSKLTAMGKGERAISVSGYVPRELVKYTDVAFDKTTVYKRHSRNHLLDQV